ncbi:hypothetical protein LJR098_000158 [Rhizobium sp. LjRoot98]|uniref:hypothetical protein n=1 Tax=Rhizobium sp. LjRoot98 TaxID=3342345 RepID=UPI003ECD6F9B
MALKSSILHCVLDAEPDTYHPADPALKTLAVNLGFECVTDVLRNAVIGMDDGAKQKRQELEADENLARDQFRQFAKAVQQVRFHLYEADLGITGTCTLSHRGEITRQISDARAPNSADDIIAWLSKAAPPQTDSRHYWTTPDAGVAMDKPVEATTAPATYRLRAAHAWNAPVAHRLSLTHVLRLEGIPQDGFYVALPSFSGAAPSAILSGAPHGELWDFTYDAGGGLGETIYRAQALEVPAAFTAVPQDINGFLSADGYLKVDPEAENLWRLTQWFEVRAASLMAPVTALAGPGTGSAEDAAYEALFQWHYGSEKKPPLLDIPAPAAAWLTAASLGAALDPIIIGLMKPVSGNTTMGDILAPLMLNLFERYRDDLAGAFALPEDCYSLAKLTGLLRNTLSLHNPLMRTTADMADAGVRRAFCESLKRVHGLQPTGAETPLEIQLLNVLLNAFASGTAVSLDEKLRQNINGDGQAILHRALADAGQRLQDETGAETAIIRVFETTEKTGNGGEPVTGLPALFAAAFAATLNRSGDIALVNAVSGAFTEAWRSYRIQLDGPFNGAEAVRRDSASEFTKALLRFAGEHKQTGMPAVQRLIAVATGAGYFAERLLRLPADPKKPEPFANGFHRIADSLVKVPFPTTWPDGITPVTPAQILPFFQASYRASLAPMTQLAATSSRFVPDHAPAPLPIQIAANIDGEEIDAFCDHFNGIAVAIRRIDTETRTDPWAHASLAELTWPVPLTVDPSQTAPKPTVPAALHPMLPATSDGRGPMFIRYEGLPFAATTFGNTAAEALALAPEAFASFYSHGAHDTESSGFAHVPRLAYGRNFESFSFATTNAGSMPLSLQADLPWMPKPVFEPPSKGGKPDPLLVTTTCYQRRTAIGQMAVNEVVTANKPRRIAMPIDGVAPLAEDYPRTVMSAFTGSPAVCDIFRDRDGSGTLSIPQLIARSTIHRISSTVLSGKPARLVARLFNTVPAGPDDDGVAKATLAFPKGFDFSALETITISLDSVRAGTPTHQRQLTIECGKATANAALTTTRPITVGWIRLSLESNEPASLSFAVADDIKPHEVGAPFLLLAPSEAPWKESLRGDVAVLVDTPRVGYLDFDRWFANATLRDAVLDETAAANLRRALLTAYVLRDADEGLSRALDRLPDPAFEAVRLELTVSDQLDGSIHTAQALILSFGFKQTMAGITQNLAEHGTGQWSPEALHDKLFKPIERAFQFSIDIASGALGLKQPDVSAQVKTLQASIPPGTVARLSMDALVPARHFAPSGKHPAVFHPGLKQQASRRIVPHGLTEAFFAYPSAAIRIETMLDGMHAIDAERGKERDKPAIQLAASMIAVRPIERSRRYDLQTRPALPDPGQKNHARQWRLLSEIDVTTQRWRPSGRPIYNHIAPLHFRDEDALSHRPQSATAAMPLKEMPVKENGKDLGYPLSRFEQEAFFDRPNIDSQTVTQRLLPLPAVTVLEQHLWEAPSATYFRHRFTLRSRYAGALKEVTRREVKAWITDRKLRVQPAEAWTLRIAMLVDLSRMLLTRPQQRALIPLTSPPRDDSHVPSTPPVLAILQEPPFSRGGLADRIAAEIKTGFGYGFTKADAPVEILDSRKEIGPDPRLTYHATEENTALGLALNAEGPMGLTFDAVNAPAPAFPNSMFSLSPLDLNGTEQNLEEHFLGISMRRYIDPNWAVEDGTGDLSGLDAGRCWWIDSDIALTPTSLLNCVADGNETPVLMLEADGNGLVIKTSKAAVDGGIAGSMEKNVAIARWKRLFASRLAILHQPVAPGRHSAAVFVLPAQNQGNVTLGHGNAPRLVCNIEWGPPKAETPANPTSVTLKADGTRARATMASAPTFLAWTRTGRNFDTVHTPDFHGAPRRGR